MPTLVSREIRLKTRPIGMPKESDFDLAQVEIAEPAEGQVQVRNIWMSVDPYMRGRMVDRESYADPFKLGEALYGGAVGQVVASRNPQFQPGDYVNNFNGWQEAFLSDGTGLTKIDASLGPIQAFLGALGMPGLTAYVGLVGIGKPKAGETVFVSAASGAVGAIVCQIARNLGCRVIGTAGSDDKCAWLRDTLKVDAAVNYRAHRSAAALEAAVRAHAPNGVDIYFDNVGGDHLEAAIGLMNPFGRLPICGMIAQYNATTPPPGPSNIIMTVPKRLHIQGFIVSDHPDQAPDFLRAMGQWIAEGRMTWKETVHEGIANAPKAFIGLFEGANFGKMLVKIGPDPAV
ncbi:MAG: NADP-dependent oxidoreductase [Alphaproteobacteria bacterium]